MRDPYEILGISSTATDDEIKKAYRTLSKKYHPDANINAPNINELTEKFKEVQNAYDTIMDMRKKGYTGDYASYANQSAYNGYNNSQNYSYREYDNFADFFNDFFTGGQQFYGQSQNSDELYYFQAVNHIKQGYYQDALRTLEAIRNRDGRWYYYSAICHSALGNNIKAMEEIKTALQYEPDNANYRQAYERMQRGRKAYRNRTYSSGNYNGGCVNCCIRLAVLNMVLNCCCGRGYFCCL